MHDELANFSYKNHNYTSKLPFKSPMLSIYIKLKSAITILTIANDIKII